MYSTKRILFAEQGFTLLELFVTMAIVMVLGAMSVTIFHMYQDNAEFAKAETALHNTITALEAGVEAMSGRPFAGGVSGANGEPLQGVLAEVLPGMVVPDKVVLQVNRMTCGFGGERFMDTVVVWACKPGLARTFVRTCGGFEMVSPKLRVGAGICNLIAG